MHKALFLILGIFFLPLVAVASSCTPDGTTVVYINGVKTSLQDAKKDLRSLEIGYVSNAGDFSIKFLNGYNQTNGNLDFWKLTAQMFAWDTNTWNEDTNGDAILNQLHSDLTTQKVLLVGYSQGTLYANETYKYLTTHGLSTGSVNNYDVGVVAPYVAGGGQYLTSTNDSEVAKARRLAEGAGLARPVPANITIPLTPQDDTGHQFTTTYLAGAGDQILNAINWDISKLTPVSNSDMPDCFTPPSSSLVHKAVVTVNGAGSMVGIVAYGLEVGAVKGTAAAVDSAFGALAQIGSDIKVAIGGVKGLAHSAQPQYEDTNLKIENALYGKNQTVDGQSVHNLLNSNLSQGGAVILATVGTMPAPAATDVVVQDASTTPVATSSVPAVPIGPAPGFSPGGGGSAPAANLVSDPINSAPSVETTVTDTSTATTADATTTIIVPPVPPPASEPIVINEIAWGGGWNAPAEQWLELYNNSDDAVPLGDIVLTSSDGAIYIPLSGTIAAHGYYMLESSDNSIFNSKNSGWSQEVSASLALSSTPQQLLLSRIGEGGTTTLDQTPAADACGGSWCAGSIAATGGFAASGGYSPMPVTMERIHASSAGADPGNWASADGYVYYANDYSQQRIIGTPYNSNSSHWPMVGFICDGDPSVLTPGSVYTYRPASNTCHYLSGYVGRDWTAEGILLKGVVGSSTIVTRIGSGPGPGKDLQTDASHTYNFSGANSGDHFTVVFYNYNNNVGGQYDAYYVGDMLHYLETGFQNDGTTASAPYSYQTVSFVIP